MNDHPPHVTTGGNLELARLRAQAQGDWDRIAWLEQENAALRTQLVSKQDDVRKYEEQQDDARRHCDHALRCWGRPR